MISLVFNYKRKTKLFIYESYNWDYVYVKIIRDEDFSDF